MKERLKREEVFALYDRQTLVATGECIPSQKQPPYADLGVGWLNRIAEGVWVAPCSFS